MNRCAAIADVDFDYVGVSLDGLGATHDKFRRMDGAFDLSLHGIRLCRDAGLKVGVRFTLTQDNFADLPGLLQLIEDEGVDRFYFSHLNYAGRGNKNRKDDAQHQMTRAGDGPAVRHLLALSENAACKRNSPPATTMPTAFICCTGCAQSFPRQAAHIEAKLRQWGGNASGVNVANIDNLGNVHPDTMWWHHTLGNVRERPFSAIWMDTSDPIMAGLEGAAPTGQADAARAAPNLRSAAAIRGYAPAGDRRPVGGGSRLLFV